METSRPFYSAAGKALRERCKVRIATYLLWEAHNNTGISYREFSILCAINSVIGKQRFIPKGITEPSIRVRAAGYKSWKIAQSELASDQSRAASFLSPHQVRYTLEQLHSRHFFARARVGAKTVKYMLGVSDDQLRATLRQREPYQAQFKAERAQKDRELVTTIRAAKRGPINVEKNQKQAVSAIFQYFIGGMTPLVQPRTY